LIEDSKQQAAEAQSIEKLACDIMFKGLAPAVTCTKRKEQKDKSMKTFLIEYSKQTKCS
jgi:hypothetical protein